MRNALVTGGSGLLGSLLIERLLRDGWSVSSVDLLPPVVSDKNLFSKQGDIRKHDDLRELLDRHRYDSIFHLAAIVAPEKPGRKELAATNVEGTRIVAEFARYHGVPNFVYVSMLSRDDVYGQCSADAEKLLEEFQADTSVVILRCPTVVGEGSLGLLAIPFTFLHEGRRVWVVEDGSSSCPMVYTADVIDAMLRAADQPESGTFNLAPVHADSVAGCYRYAIEKTRSKSQLASLPKVLAQWLKFSVLDSDKSMPATDRTEFEADAAKNKLGWNPQLSGREMFIRAYRYFAENRSEIEARRHASSNRRPAKMGAIALLKWFS